MSDKPPWQTPTLVEVYPSFTNAKLAEFKRGYEAASTDAERASYALSALNMCARRPLPGWLYVATSDLWAAQFAPLPQKELAFLVGDQQLRREFTAKGKGTAHQAEVDAAKKLGFYKEKAGGDAAEAEERAVETLRKTRTRYRLKLRRIPGKRKRSPEK